MAAKAGEFFALRHTKNPLVNSPSGTRSDTLEAAQSGAEIVEITTTAALDELRPEWSELFEACPDASPFQSPEWLVAWLRAFLNEGLWTLAIRRHGRLVGLAAFFIYRAPEGDRQVTFVGNGISDRLDILARPRDRDYVFEAVFRHLAHRADLWDSCDFRDVPPGSPLAWTTLAASFSDELQAEEPCPAVRLPAQAEQVWDLLAPRRRADLRRCGRRAATAGELACETATADNRARVLEELMQLHRLRWEARGQPGVLADAAVQRFHYDATDGLLERGLLRLYTLRLDGRAIAAQYALHHNGRAYSYLIAFDPASARFSPGLLLTAFTLEQAVREGAREFDFLRGREDYKYLWGAVDQPRVRRRIRR
jgi:CelD/BcsL family acetyltransferase involved in cellulose biosynthesis